MTYITYMYFALQTGFVFSNTASGIAAEFATFENRSDFNNGTLLIKDLYNNDCTNGVLPDGKDCNVDPNAGDFIEPPKWTDCSTNASRYRDYLKFRALPYIHTFPLNSSEPDGEKMPDYADLWDKWNTDKEDGKGHCTFGSGQNQMTMTYISFTGWLRYAGGFSASLSSAIASMVGAPRILQAVGKDGIYPGVYWFEKGFNANNDPWRGYILVFVIAMGGVMLAKLNTIGIVASNFFLAAYALMNLSCFHSSYTNSPGWRPSFKYYNKWVSLFAAVVCVALMFVMDWRYAVGTVGCQILLGSYIYLRKPEANWGSSADAQTFITAMKSTQDLTDSPDHIKTYRPKILVLTGSPAHRPSLVDFANIITKKLSLLVCAHVMEQTPEADMTTLKEEMQHWLKDHGVGGYYAATVGSKSFSEGAKNCMNLVGLGKMAPNMVLAGFKQNWTQDLPGLREYIDVMYSALDLRLGFSILRCKEGLDFSKHIASEQQIIREVPVEAGDDENNLTTPPPAGAAPKTRKVSTAVYRGHDGHRLDNHIIEAIQQFQPKKRSGNIDVWWLYDDGGLTLLIPHIIKTRKQFKNCKIRVFSLANKSTGLDLETRNLASMLSRFRIEYADVTVVPDVTKKADGKTKAEFEKLIEGAGIDDMELQVDKEKTNRNLRLAEMVRQYSKESEMLVMTLPLPRRGQDPALYMAWLDIISTGMPPTLFIRGNQQPVLTFFS